MQGATITTFSKRTESKKFYCYQVAVRGADGVRIIWRRYSQFLLWHQTIRTLFPHLVTAPFPSKRFVTRSQVCVGGGACVRACVYGPPTVCWLSRSLLPRCRRCYFCPANQIRPVAERRLGELNAYLAAVLAHDEVRAFLPPTHAPCAAQSIPSRDGGMALTTRDSTRSQIRAASECTEFFRATRDDLSFGGIDC